MSQVARRQSDECDPAFIRFNAGTLSAYEVLRSPAVEIQRCILDAQREASRLEAIVHQLAAAIHRDGIASFGAVALFQESNRQLKRELDEFTLDSLALVSIGRQLQSPECNGA